MRLIILGAGGYGRTVADVASQSGRYAQIRFLDDKGDVSQWLGRCADFPHFKDEETEMIPAFGDNELRLKWMDRLSDAGIRQPTLIHKTAYLSPTVSLAEGTVILPHATVNTGCRIERGCIVNCGAIIDHDCVLEEGVHICLGTIIKGGNRIPRCMKIEAGIIVTNGVYPL